MELKETIAIPSLLLRKEYKKAGAQIVDIFKMTGLAVVWGGSRWCCSYCYYFKVFP